MKPFNNVAMGNQVEPVSGNLAFGWNRWQIAVSCRDEQSKHVKILYKYKQIFC